MSIQNGCSAKNSNLMRIYLFGIVLPWLVLFAIGFFSLLSFAQSSRADTSVPAPISNRTQVYSSGDYWSSAGIFLRNSLNDPLDLQGMTLLFEASSRVDSVWGEFEGVAYPQSMVTTNTSLPGGRYLVQVKFLFPEGDWVDTSLERNTEIEIQFGVGAMLTLADLDNITVYLPVDPDDNGDNNDGNNGGDNDGGGDDDSDQTDTTDNNNNDNNNTDTAHESIDSRVTIFSSGDYWSSAGIFLSNATDLPVDLQGMTLMF